MFRCKCPDPNGAGEVHGIYLQTVLDAHGNLQAVIVWEKKLINAPIHTVTWTGWVE
jgi:hypothetical protein